MSIGVKKAVIVTLIIIIGFIVGRLLVRALMNLLVGGTLFGGNIL